MTSRARTLGAPVTEPGGNAAAISCPSLTPAGSRPRTSETRCQTPGCASARSRAGTRTLPGRQTRLRSLRIRSTIIMFSARSLAERSSAARWSAAASWPAGRGRVPLIGLDQTAGPVRRRNSSGDRLATAPPGSPRNAA